MQKRTIFKLPATLGKHTDTHPCTNTAMRYSFLTGRLPPTGVKEGEGKIHSSLEMPPLGPPRTQLRRLAKARCPRCGPRSRDRPLQGKSCLSFRAFPPAKIRQPLPASLTFFQKTARNKSELPLLPHMEDTGTFCCRSSPFSSFCLQLPPPPSAGRGAHRWPHHPPGRSVYIQSSARRSAIGPCPALLTSCRLACVLRTPLLPGADAAASAFGTGSPRLLKATALHL